MATNGIQESTPLGLEAAIARARQLAVHHRETFYVITSTREPGKWYIESGAPMVRNFERIEAEVSRAGTIRMHVAPGE